VQPLSESEGLRVLATLEKLSPLQLSEKAIDLEKRAERLHAEESWELARGRSLNVIGPNAQDPQLQQLGSDIDESYLALYAQYRQEVQQQQQPAGNAAAPARELEGPEQQELEAPSGPIAEASAEGAAEPEPVAVEADQGTQDHTTTISDTVEVAQQESVPPGQSRAEA